MRKSSILVLSVLLLTFFSAQLYATNYLYEGILYVLNPEKHTASVGEVRKYGKIYIPDFLSYDGENYRVIMIGYNSFPLSKSDSITDVRFPNGLELISSNSRLDYTGWYKKLPNGVVYAGGCLFKYKGTMPDNTRIKIKDGTQSISYGAFGGCKGLTSITIPEGVTTIGENAFSNCSGLKVVNIPCSVSKIGNDAFYRCYNLDTLYWNAPKVSTNYGFPSDVKAIIKKLIIGDSIHHIGSFPDYTGLKMISIPSSVESIDGRAFFSCRTVDTLYWNSNVSPFYVTQYCNNTLKYVKLGDNLTSIGDGSFNGCFRLTSLEIPSGVSSIGDAAFKGCSGLGSIIIPDSVTIIGKSAFYGCRSLISIVIPESVMTIGDNAFWGCKSLSSISMPKNITSIGIGVYEGCSSLTGIDIANGVTTIGNRAFYGCSGLSSITIPQNVTSIGESAFYGCCGLTSLIIPEGVSSLGNHAFDECSGLTYIYVPSSLKTLLSSFEGCTNVETLIWNSPYEGIYYISQQCYSKLKNVSLGEKVSGIGSTSFRYCTGITSIEIPESVTGIGWEAFLGCTGLTSIVIPEGVISFGDRAFSGCRNLTSVSMPSTIYSVGENVFAGCDSISSLEWNSNASPSSVAKNKDALKRVHIGPDVTEIRPGAFWGFVNLTDVTVLSNKIEKIGYEAFAGCTNLPKITYLYDETAVNIPNSVTEIGDFAFSDCKKITAIRIPQGVLRIGRGVFVNCTNLKELVVDNRNEVYDSRNNCNAIITTSNNSLIMGCAGSYIPETVTSIGSYAFNNCTNLKTINIPQSVNLISDGAFVGCSNLLSITVDVNNTKYDSRNNCNAIIETYYDAIILGCQNTVIPDGIRKIGEKAFLYCEDLIAIDIPESVNIIGSSAFYGCSGLTSFVVPSKVTYIAQSLFYGCTNLSSVVIHDKVKSIGDKAFELTGLKSIYVYATDPKSIGVDDRTFYQHGTNGCKLFVPASSIAEYRNNEPWSSFNYIFGITDYDIIDKLHYKKSSKTVYSVRVYYGMTNSEKIRIPVSIPDSENEYDVTSIGDSAFAGFNNLKSITMPDGVETIGNYAFAGCDNLKEVIVKAVNPPALSDSSFDSSHYKGGTLYVPYESVDLYKATLWGEFECILNIEGLYNLIYVLDGETYAEYVVHQDSITVVPDRPEREGLTFLGWSAIPDSMPAQDITVTGSFSVNKYLLTIFVDSITVFSDSIAYGTKLIDYIDGFVQQGIDFTGWKEYAMLETITMPAHDMTIVGLLPTPTYVITYMVDGIVVERDTISPGSVIVPPVIVPRDGYNFVWNDLPELMPDSDIVIEGTYVTNISGIYPEETEYRIFTIDGKPLEIMRRGINVISNSDGLIRKVIIE